MAEATAEASHHDVVVVGGAFAGAATAIQIQRAAPGRRILILEREEKFGRKVGEATVEASGIFLTRILGEYLVNAVMLGVPLYKFGIPEPIQQCIDISGSEGTPDQLIARGKQPIDSFVSAAH